MLEIVLYLEEGSISPSATGSPTLMTTSSTQSAINQQQQPIYGHQQTGNFPSLSPSNHQQNLLFNSPNSSSPMSSTSSSSATIAAITPVVPASQLSPISPTLPVNQTSYTSVSADVCHQYYNAYNYAAAAAAGGKMRTTSPYGRSSSAAYQPPYHHPHQFNPNAPFYSRTVQNPYDYSPR